MHDPKKKRKRSNWKEVYVINAYEYVDSKSEELNEENEITWQVEIEEIKSNANSITIKSSLKG